MSLLFLGAADHKLSVRDFDALELKFARLAAETAQNIIRLYQSRKTSAPRELIGNRAVVPAFRKVA